MDLVYSNKNNLGILKENDIFFKFINWNDLSVLDIGCGNGDLAFSLAKEGAKVIGIEHDSIQAKKNIFMSNGNNLIFKEGSANNLSLESNSMDVIIFSKSLHHIPINLMDSSLIEVARVLKNNTGRLLILEPSIKGSYFQLLKPFHDETIVRKAALDSLARISLKYFKEVKEYKFQSKYKYKNFNTFVDKFSSSTFNNIKKEDVESDEVKNFFLSFKNGDDYVFYNDMIFRIYSNYNLSKKS